MSYELKGTIKVLGEVINVSDKFAKREVVITTEDTYPQDVLVQFTQDGCGLLDEFSVGSKVVVAFNLLGREWTSPKGEVKWFNTLQGWRINADNTDKAVKPNGKFDVPVAKSKPLEVEVVEEDSELPF